MWQSFAAIGRGTSEIWLPKEKNICGKTEARPELIVPGGLINLNIRERRSVYNMATNVCEVHYDRIHKQEQQEQSL